jgi:hypothetical protein
MTEGTDVDDELWRLIEDDVSAALLKLKQADVLSCRLKQTVS